MFKMMFCASAFCLLAATEGCGDGVKTGSTTKKEMEQTESNHAKLVESTPPPQFEHSLERDNLVRRLKALNVQNKIMYIYCMTMDGKVVRYDTVEGKVSSLNSYLTTPEQVVAIPGQSGGITYHVLPSPDFDGSYGKNPEGVFWFNTAGAYCEWSGYYFLSDQPLKINTPITLTANVDVDNPKPTSAEKK
jgi:hypothetical protein